MIGKSLAVGAINTEGVDLPRLEQFASGAAPAFVMHRFEIKIRFARVT